MKRRTSDLDRIVQGLRAQFERTAHFEGDVDLDRAVTGYVRVAQLLLPRLPQLRAAAGLPERPPVLSALRTRFPTRRYRHAPAPTDRVYTFWNRPLHEAPPLVRACLTQLRRVYPDVHVLDGDSAREFIDIPDCISAIEHDRIAHFTDYVRTRLLEEHGGIWTDSTVWIARDLAPELQARLVSGTLFPRWTDNQIANWFIASHPRTTIIRLQRLALQTWWENNEDLPDYFLYHRIFEVLRASVPEFRAQWRATPALSSTTAHLLQLQMMQPHEPAVLDGILSIAPIQKLSYKYDTVPEGSVLEHLIDT